jgi:hypoxanthine phosphoribosyltransferase
MSVSAAEAQRVLERADCLYSAKQVDQAFDRMAASITAALHDVNPVVMCVMNGALVPAGHLVVRLHFPLQIDYLHATRYRGATAGGELHWVAKPQCDVRGRQVLVIDDILDEGVTLAAIMDHLRGQGAVRVRSAVLVEKLHERKSGLRHADFVGLQVEDRYVFGYGMDYKGYLRNAPGIYAVSGDD